MEMEQQANPEPAKPEVKPAFINVEAKVEQKASNFDYKKLLVIVAVVFAIGYVVNSNYPNLLDGITGFATVSDKANIDLYVMSQCPYGVQAENSFKEVVDKMKGYVNMNIEFIGQTDGTNFNSLHGEPEVIGDLIQACAKNHYPAVYFDFIACQNKNNPSDLVSSLTTCADEIGIDSKTLETCYQGEEGKALLAASFQKAQSLNVQGSPTIYLNGVQYAGGRAPNDLIRAICEATGNKAPACAELPEIKEVKITVLNDARCKECDSAPIIQSLKNQLFPKLAVTNLDYSTEEGKALYNELQLTALPAILFTEEVKTDANYVNIERYFVPSGKYLNLMIGASFDPTKEICDNEVDDNNNELIDCADTECNDAFECREEIKKDLQLFVMSDCPYGKEAVKALKEVVTNFKEDVKYSVHYIANEQNGEFQSLHGQYEVDEDIVQLCVNKYASQEKWLNFIYCRSTNGVKDLDWKDCALAASIDSTKVETCSKGDEGKALLSEDIKIAQELNIGGSPTWIANNQKQFGGFDANTIKQTYCEANPGLSGCTSTLSTSEAPAGGCGTP
ncbi:MAG: DsbA family protein [Candidatus Woesearchaeota archaeon]